MRVLHVFALLVGLTCAGQALAVEPRALLEVADFSAPVISPDGKRVAFRIEQASVERNTYDAFWYVQDVDGASAPRRIADGGFVLRDSAGMTVPAKVLWSPDSRWIYYRALVDGKLEVWRASTEGAGARPVTDDLADVRAFALADEGRTLNYSVGPTRQTVLDAEQSEYDRGIHVDATTPLGQSLFRSGAIEGRLATQRYGKVWFDRMPLLGDTPDQWKAVDLQTWATREIALVGDAGGGPAVDDDPDVVERAHSPEDGRYAILTRFGEKDGLRDRPNVRLSASLSGDDADLRVCKASLCTGRHITSLQWRPRHDEVLFTVTDPAMAQSVFVWNVSTGVVRPLAESAGLLNGGRVSSTQCGVSSADLVCVSATARRPPRLERIDLETGSRKVLFEPNAALAQAMVKDVSIRTLRWKDSRGKVFAGQFYTANDSPGKATPLFVNYYQCAGFVRGGLGDEWAFASLATHGIAALCINASPYEIEPLDRYDNAVFAVEGAVKLLSASGEIDPARVGMGGLSFGSEVTHWVTMKSRLLSAASVTSPSVSSTYYLFGSMKGAKFRDGLKELWGLGSLEETPERWKRISPQFALDKMTVPVLFQMPEQEYLMALDYAIPLIQKGLGDLYVFPDEPHQKFQPRHKLAAYERNMDWFRFWLQGFEDPDPAKADQYVHWREMRASSPSQGHQN